MGRYLDGLAAGFVATVVMSVVMVVNLRTGLLPRFDPPTDLMFLANHNGYGPVTPPIGWAMHFVLGTVVLGLIYARVRKLLPYGPITSGIIYGLMIWIVGVVFFHPLVGFGLLAKGLEAGLNESAAALLLDIVFGVTLGIVYSNLRSSAATHDVMPG